MASRLLLAAAVTAVACSAASAATLTTDLAAWQAQAGVTVTTSSTGLPLYSTTTSIPLSGGGALGTTGDTVLAPLSGWGPWSGGYAGDIFNTSGRSETLTFTGLTALGLDLAPDVPLQGPYGETFTVTLSDGSTTSVSGSYPPGTTQFVGFTGAGITSMTISASTAPDFAFGDIRSASAAPVGVPEPASFALVAAGLALVGLRRRNA